MARAYLIRGMLVGLLAALVAFVVAKTLGESAVGHAISFESARAAAAGETEGTDLVSRDLQSTLGLLTGLTAFSVAIGGIFALTFASLYGRVTVPSARGASALIALFGYVTVFLVPALKYPPNPPSIGNPDTIGRRTALYFTMLVLSIGTAAVAFQLARLKQAEWGTWNVGIAGVIGYAVVIGVLMAVLPRVHETPEGFDANVLWHFRIASAGIQLTVYSTLGLAFGFLTERAQRTERTAPAGALAASLA